MTENVTEQLANFATQIGFDDLPEEVINKMKWMLLDSIGCAFGGYDTEKTRITLDLVKELGGNPQACIIGGPRTSYALASFINAELINALDYDYNGPLVGHVLPFVTPPCLSMAERQNVSGRELILALVLGHEVGGRVVSALSQQRMPKPEPPYYDESPRYSYSATVLGGVAGAGRLLGFDVEKMRNAFGIAGASTAVPSGMKWFRSGGPANMMKYGTGTGWISQLATTAVLLAEKGFTGDTTILDGEWGFWQIIGSSFFKADNLFKGLGEVWHASQVEYKLYPCCRCNHAGIDGICSLMQQHGIKPEEIEEIVVKGDSWLQVPLRTSDKLESFLDIQFVNMYIFGLAPYFGLDPGPAWQTPENYNLAAVKEMAKKVRVELHPQTDEVLARKVKAGQKPGFRSTIVELKAKGKRFEIEVPEPRGAPDNPPSETELLEKFSKNASYFGIKPDRVEHIIELILKLDELDNVRALTNLLSGDDG